MMPAAMTAATASPALRTSSKLAMMQRASCGLGTSFTVTSIATASMPSLPITTRQQVEAGRVERLAAELDRLALDGEAAHLQHVVQRQAVLQAVHAARVLGDVAADRAGDLAATDRARSTGRSGAAASLIARLRTPHCTRAVRAQRDRSARMRLNLARRQRHAEPRAASRRRTGPVPAPRATTGTPSAWQARSTACDLRLGLGQRDDERLLAVGGEAVAFVGRGVFALPQQRVRRQQRRAARRRPRAWRSARARSSGSSRCVHGDESTLAGRARPARMKKISAPLMTTAQAHGSCAASPRRPRIPSDPSCRCASRGNARAGSARCAPTRAPARRCPATGAPSFRRTSAMPRPCAAASHMRPMSLNDEPSAGSPRIDAVREEPRAPRLERALDQLGAQQVLDRVERARARACSAGEASGVTSSVITQTCSTSA